MLQIMETSSAMIMWMLFRRRGIFSTSSFTTTYSIVSFTYSRTETNGANVGDEEATAASVGANPQNPQNNVGVDPLDPAFINFDIDYGDEEAFRRLKRKLSVQKDAALIVQRREKAKAFVEMAKAEKEIIR